MAGVVGLACVLVAAGAAYRADPDAGAWVAEHFGALTGADDLSGAHRGDCLGPRASGGEVVVPCGSGAAKLAVLSRMSLTSTEFAENECPSVPGWNYTSGGTDMDWSSGNPETHAGLCLVPASQAAAALRARPGDPVAGLHVAEGTLIVSLGDSVTRQDLFAVGAGGCARRLTGFGTGTGSFGAGAGQVVFPAPEMASGPVLPSASLYRYGASGAAPLGGKWGSDSNPAVSSTGALAYWRAQDTGHYRRWQLLAQAGPNAPMRVLETADVSEAPSQPAWGSAGQLAVSSMDGTLSIYNADSGRLVRRITSAKAPGVVVWGPGDPIAVNGGLVDPATGHVAAPPRGYLPLAWSPDGSRTLLATGPDRRRLYLIPAASPAAVQQLPGSTPQDIWSAAWMLNPPRFGKEITMADLERQR